MGRLERQTTVRRGDGGRATVEPTFQGGSGSRSPALLAPTFQGRSSSCASRLPAPMKKLEFVQEAVDRVHVDPGPVRVCVHVC